MKLTFFGGAGTVTGSKILLEVNYKKILIDCGLFQGLKELRVKNWEPIPPELKELDLVILTHAHLDHTGYLPILVKKVYSGKIYSTKPTKDLTEIILLDSAKIQEKDARRANEYHYTKHHPAKPLYEVDDAKLTITHFKTFDLDTWNVIDDQVKFKFVNIGHILGSAFVVFFKINEFSGHADQSELLDWLKHFKQPPALTIINHGEQHQSQAFKTKIKTDLNWNCTVAKLNNAYYLD